MSPFLSMSVGCMRMCMGSFSHVNLTEEEQEQLLIDGRCFLACATEKNSNHGGKVIYYTTL